jgi:hypothetical protein
MPTGARTPSYEMAWEFPALHLMLRVTVQSCSVFHATVCWFVARLYSCCLDLPSVRLPYVVVLARGSSPARWCGHSGRGGIRGTLTVGRDVWMAELGVVSTSLPLPHSMASRPTDMNWGLRCSCYSWRSIMQRWPDVEADAVRERRFRTARAVSEECLPFGTVAIAACLPFDTVAIELRDY